MFESIIIKTLHKEFDLGFFAECLFFYNKVYFFPKKGDLEILMRTQGYSTIHELIDMGILEIYISTNMLGTSNREGAHTLELVHTTTRDIREYEIFNSCKSFKSSKKIARGFRDKIDEFRHDSVIMDHLAEAVCDHRLIKDIAVKALDSFDDINNYAINDIGFSFFLRDDKRTVDLVTNLDFNKINSSFSNKNLKYNCDFDANAVLLPLISGIEDITIASKYDSEISTGVMSDFVIDRKISLLGNQNRYSQDQLSVFQRYSFEDSLDIRAVINSGAKNLVDLLPLLKKAQKFKEWKKGLSSKQDFLQEYSLANKDNGWLKSAPIKVIRWAVVATIGLIPITTIPAVALSLFDTFMLDKMCGKWKPNIFIDGDCKEFIKGRF